MAAKQIFVKYWCPPLWNAALNFLFWVSLAFTSVVVCYLFLVYVMDTAIKDVDPSKANDYDDTVKKYLSAVPLLGKHLYPQS